MALVPTIQQLRVSRCYVREFTLALDLTAVLGVERADRITPVESEWPQIGILPTPASDVPIFSLAGLLGLPELPTQRGAHLLLVETPSGIVGLLADQTEQGFPVSAVNFLRMPVAAKLEHFPAVVRTTSGLLPWLDPVGLFAGMPTREVPRESPWRFRQPTTARNRLMVIPLPHSRPGERAWAVGIPAAAVAELVEAGNIVAVPGAPCHVDGIMLWRDRVIGLLDLSRWLRLPSQPLGHSWIAILAVPGQDEPIGLRIPRGMRMLKLPLPNICSLRRFPGYPERFITAVEVGEQTVGLLDLAGFNDGPFRDV
ncbi:MAG: chemotaxis protein CheW [Gemmataceae bacterium]